MAAIGRDPQACRAHHGYGQDAVPHGFVDHALDRGGRALERGGGDHTLRI
jgi:hypothetical protein